MKPPAPVTKASSDFMIPPRSNCRRPRLRHAPAKSVYQFRRKLRPRPSQAVLRWLVYAQFPRSSSGNSDHTGRTFDCDPGTERCGLLLQGLQNSAGIGCVGQIRNTAPRRFVRIAHVERVEPHGFGFGIVGIGYGHDPVIPGVALILDITSGCCANSHPEWAKC